MNESRLPLHERPHLRALFDFAMSWNRGSQLGVNRTNARAIVDEIRSLEGLVEAHRREFLFSFTERFGAADSEQALNDFEREALGA